MLLSLIQVCIISISLSATAQLNAQDCAITLQVAQAKKAKVMLSFEEAELVGVVMTMSKLTGKNFIVEDRIRTRRITIISATKVSVEEAYQAFVASLETEGLKIVKNGKFYTISRKDPFSFRRSPNKERSSSKPSSKKDCPKFEGVTQVNATTYKIPKSFISGFVDNSSCVAMQARIVPSFKDGKPNGFKLFGIRPSSFWSKLGFTNGDIIQKINGQEITTPDKALEVYSQLKTATKIEVDLIRRGNQKKFTYHLEK
jgi:type II secretion system GspD-like secretin